MKHQLIAGLDIGTTEVRLVVGQRVKGEGGEKLQILVPPNSWPLIAVEDAYVFCARSARDERRQ